MTTTCPSTGRSSRPQSTARGKERENYRWSDRDKSSISNLRIHCGLSPDQVPSGWHCLVLFPLSVYPVMQLYVATDDRVIDPEATLPPTGGCKVPQSIAVNSTEYYRASC